MKFIDGFQPRNGPGNRDPARLCTVCGRKGHETSACFKVVRYPDWHGDKTRSKTTPMGRGRGTFPNENSTQIVSLTDGDRQGVSGITDEQWQLIQRVLNGGKPSECLSGKDDVSWILDTGATHHMTGKIDLLDDIRDIDPTSVILPAGSSVVST